MYRQQVLSRESALSGSLLASKDPKHVILDRCHRMTAGGMGS
jgi:hypothetical protein